MLLTVRLARRSRSVARPPRPPPPRHSWSRAANKLGKRTVFEHTTGPALVEATRPAVLSLFRRVWRTSALFENPSARDYYRANAHEHIFQNSDQTDPEAIEALVARGEDMRLWVAKKYGLEDARGADGAASTAPRRGLDLTRAGPRAAR